MNEILMKKRLFLSLFSFLGIFALLFPVRQIEAANVQATVKIYNYKGQPYIQISNPRNSSITIVNTVLKQFAVTAAMHHSESTKANSEFWYKTTTKLMYNKNNKVSISNETSSFQGGVHDHYWTDTHNFDLTSGKRIFLKDILNSKAKIQNAKAYISYVLTEKYKKGVPIFEENINDFNLDMLYTPFYLRDSAITIRFNPYEVGPFSEGIIDVTVPMSAIEKHVSKE